MISIPLSRHISLTPSAILNLTSSSSPLLSSIVLPAGPADGFLQMCCALIGCLSCFLAGLSHRVSYFHSDAEESAEDYGRSVSTNVRGSCPPVCQLVRKQHTAKELRRKQDLINYCTLRCKCILLYLMP